MASPSPVYPASVNLEPISHKAILKRLQSVCGDLNQYDPTDVAQEITRHECELFLLIQVRHSSALYIFASA